MQKSILLCVGVLFAGQLRAQTLTPTVVSSSGGFYTSATAMLSTTIGEMTMVETFQSPANFLTQGFQQPEDLGVGLEEINQVANLFSVFPNPATDAITLKADFTEKGTLHYSIFNALGQNLLSDDLIPKDGSVSKTINVKALSPGIYFVQADFISTTNKKQTFTQKLTIQK